MAADGTTQLWTSLHATITSATARIREMENRVFAELTSKLLESYESIFANTRIIDELDVALGFAELAHEMQLTRPTMTEGCALSLGLRKRATESVSAARSLTSKVLGTRRSSTPSASSTGPLERTI